MTNKGMLALGGIVASVGYAVYSQIKLEIIAAKLKVTVDELAVKTNVQIEESMLERAAEQAVEREVMVIARKAAVQATVEVKEVYRKEVFKAVDAKYGDIAKSVTDQIAVEVAKIDKRALQKTITEKAEEKVIAKFEGSLDDLLDVHTKKLESVDAIYSSIADRLKRNDDTKTISLRV